MSIEPTQHNDPCPNEVVAAYVDGELDPREESEFEEHMAVCAVCADAYSSQRELLLALDSIREEKAGDLTLPSGFTKTVAASAESNLSGIRSARERSRGFLICGSLLLLVTASFGAQDAFLGKTVVRIADRIVAVVGFAFHLFYEAGVGLSVVLGSFCNKYLFDSVVPLAVLLGSFVIASVILSRLVYRANRL